MAWAMALASAAAAGPLSGLAGAEKRCAGAADHSRPAYTVMVASGFALACGHGREGTVYAAAVGVATLYLDGAPGRLIVENRLRAAADGNVELRRRFWAFEQQWEHPALTPPLLVYADLLGTGDARCIETAQRVFDGHLARLVAEK